MVLVVFNCDKCGKGELLTTHTLEDDRPFCKCNACGHHHEPMTRSKKDYSGARMER